MPLRCLFKMLTKEYILGSRPIRKCMLSTPIMSNEVEHQHDVYSEYTTSIVKRLYIHIPDQIPYGY